MRKILFFLVWNISLGPLAPWILGLALGRKPRKVDVGDEMKEKFPEHEVNTYRCEKCRGIVIDETVEQAPRDTHIGGFAECDGRLTFTGKVIRKFKSTEWGDFDK